MVVAGHTEVAAQAGFDGAARNGSDAKLRSLKTRLIAVSLAWLVFSLLATGAVLVLLFRAHMQRHFDQTLIGNLEDLAAAVQIQPGGAVKLTWEPADPLYRKAASGWYWEIRDGERVVKASPSLMGQSIPVAATASQPQRFDNIPGPGGVRLRIMAEQIRKPGGGVLFVAVSGPCVTVQQDVFTFIGQLAAALITLGLTLGALVAAQVTYGLRPLRMVRAALADVRLGRHARFDADRPVEIAPLIDELNTLLDERDAMLAEARAEAGNLAHALKTPIAVIRNEASELGGQAGAVLEEEANKMARVVEHHLVRARAQARPRQHTARAQLDPIMEDMRFSLQRLYPERLVDFDVPAGLSAACSEEDLGEMVGNLADNACKWARSRVRISARALGGRLRVEIEDDGAGLSKEQRVRVLVRGERLDERTPGHGLGLSIVSQLTALNGGSLRLERSQLGGLSAILDLRMPQ